MATRPEPTVGSDETGFSLIETMIAMTILATGLLSMAGVFIMGLSQLAGSSASLIAREKAREAVESVHTARDIRTLPWCRIRNVGTATGCADGAAGAFVTGAQPLRTAGLDGLVNTADDGDIEVSLGPGAGRDSRHYRRYRNADDQLHASNRDREHSSAQWESEPEPAAGDGHHRFQGGPVAADLRADDLHLGDFLRL